MTQLETLKQQLKTRQALALYYAGRRGQAFNDLFRKAQAETAQLRAEIARLEG